MAGSRIELSPRTVSRIAGIGYLVIIFAGIFAEFIVRGTLKESGDTFASEIISASESLFRLGIAGDLIMVAADILVAVALYVLLAQVNRGVALLATAFRLVHSAVYGAGILSLCAVVALLGVTETPLGIEAGQLDSFVATALSLHDYAYAVGLVFFGFHCLILGYLLFRAAFVPKILGILMIAAALGYLVDSFGFILMSNYAEYEAVLSIVVFGPAIIAELSLAIWLLFKGASYEMAPQAT